MDIDALVQFLEFSSSMASRLPAISLLFFFQGFSPSILLLPRQLLVHTHKHISMQ